jgi:hypothetical protein
VNDLEDRLTDLLTAQGTAVEVRPDLQRVLSATAVVAFNGSTRHRLSPPVQTEAQPPTPTERVQRSSRWLVAAVALLVLAIGGLGLASRTGESGPETDVATADPPSAPVQRAFFHGTGTPREVADAYLTERGRVLPDQPSVERFVAEKPIVQGTSATVRWHLEADGASDYAGTIHLVQAGGGWDVVLAEADRLDISDLHHSGSRLTGAVRSTDIDALTVMVTSAGGTLLTHSTRPDFNLDGRLLSDPLPEGGRLVMDLEVPAEPVLVRVQHVGGAFLSIAEQWIDPPSGANPAADAPDSDTQPSVLGGFVSSAQNADDAAAEILESFDIEASPLGAVRCAVDTGVCIQPMHLADDSPFEALFTRTTPADGTDPSWLLTEVRSHGLAVTPAGDGRLVIRSRTAGSFTARTLGPWPGDSDRSAALLGAAALLGVEGKIAPDTPLELKTGRLWVLTTVASDDGPTLIDVRFVP